MGYEVQVESAERRLEPVPQEKVCQRICRAAEKLDRVSMVPWKELTNNRMYRSKVRACGNVCTIKYDGVSGEK